MKNYRRANVPDATWFFTVNLAKRKGNRLLIEYIDELLKAFRYVKEGYPVQIKAIVLKLHVYFRRRLAARTLSLYAF